jgi:hypothetical protein
MAITLDHVRKLLTAEEPNYTRAARLGPEILPYLQTLVQDPNPMLASKATHLAGLIKDEGALNVLHEAAKRAEPVVRLAAAAAARNLEKASPHELLARLVNDVDEGVRKVALKSVGPEVVPHLKSALEEVANKDNVLHLRSLSRQLLSRFAGSAAPAQPAEAPKGEGVGELIPAPQPRLSAPGPGEALYASAKAGEAATRPTTAPKASGEGIGDLGAVAGEAAARPTTAPKASGEGIGDLGAVAVAESETENEGEGVGDVGDGPAKPKPPRTRTRGKQ